MAVNPILPGFNPDPSIVRVDGAYYLVTSTFEYLPGMPVYRSEDLEDWSLIGHVATREEQLGIRHSPTPGGVFAPTIRFHDGRFHVIVSVMFNARGCVVFTADSPEGPWSDGVEIPAVDGIDPDLAWDDAGAAYVTYAVMGHGIRQLRVDLETGAALEEPRSLWSGTGHAPNGAPPQTPGSPSHAPEGPHLYRRGDDWYLLIAEGGTERGHTVAIARGKAPVGPFEGYAGNPILTARSTSSPVQNVGHADLVEAPDGGTALVALGVRPGGFTRSFSPLGRETFLTSVEWIDGWPRVAPIVVSPRPGAVVEALDTSEPLERSGWIAVRQTPSDVASVDSGGRVVLTGHGTDLRDPLPSFVGRRQEHLAATFSARVDASTGVGGIAARHSEAHWFGIDARDDGALTRVTVRAALAGFTHEWRAELPVGEVLLSIRSRESSADLGKLEVGGDRIQLVAASVADAANEVVVAELDGRYWAYETTESFTGRVLGLYATDGTVAFDDVTYGGKRMTGCRDLRVEYLRAPIGIGVRAPRFTWIVDHAQAAYELEVRVGDVLVWAPGIIESGETALIEYAGDPLRSNTAYRWRVRSRAAEGGWTEWASSTFETALLDASDWVASWVEPAQQDAVVERWSIVDWIRGLGPDTPPEERLRPPQLLRQQFVVREEMVRARLYATARGSYSAFFNGRRADDQVLAPGSDSYEHRISVQCYDVTAALIEGENVLGVALADGWWAGRLGLTGSSAQFGTRTSAIWQLHIEYVDGTTDVVASGADVRSAVGPWAYADLFVGELFDRRAVPGGWDRAGFDDDGWMPVAEVAHGDGALVPFAGEPIRRVLELPPVSLVETPEGTIVDFGQVLVGRLRLRLPDTTSGQRIVLEHTETLAADGSWFANIVGINKEQTDVFIAAGVRAEGADEGTEEWEPEFTFHGFRYARISGLSSALEPDDVVAVVLASDLEQTGSFEASDPRLDRLHQNVVWSQRGNFLSVPTDCPQRERAGWTGDIQAFVGAASNNAQVVPFLSRWLDNLRADQLADGRIPIFSPRSPFDADAAATAQGIGSIVAAAGWSDAIAIVPWVLYERYGDRRVLEDNYDAMLRWIDYQRTSAAAEVPEALVGAEPPRRQRRAQALLYNTGAHFGDWLTPSTMEGRPMHEAIGIAPALTSEYVAPMFQAQTLTIATRIAIVLGRETDAVDLAARAGEVRAAFAAEYVDDDGDLPVRLQGVYVLALAFGMVPEELRARTAERLVELIRARGNRLDTGFLSTPHLLDVLCDNGYPEVARALLWQSEMPSWLYEVDRGATTIWESWDAISPDGEIRPMSFNHYAPGSVDDWLYRRVAGIRSTSPGYRTAMIEPDFEAGVDHVRAHVGTPYGPLAVEWTRTGDAASITIDVPHGVTAELATPGGAIPLDAGRSIHALAVPPK